jgi:hypothetical protein
MKIQILSLPRTGSTYLFHMLNLQLTDCEDFYSISEPFNVNKKNFKKSVKNILKNKNVLVKSHVYELIYIKESLLFRKYCSVDWHTICLLRKNVFEMTLSRAIALIVKNWDNLYCDGLKLKINPLIFKKQLLESLYWLRLIKYNSFNVKNIIYYEELTFDSSQDMKRLNLPIEHTIFYKSKKFHDNKQIVSNYNDLYLMTEKLLKNVTDLSFDKVSLVNL